MKFYFRIFLSAKMIILVLSFLGKQTAGAETYRVYGLVSGDILNIRERPSSKSKKISFIPPYEKGIEKLAPCESGWCKISYRGMTGWCSMKYLALEPSVDSSKYLALEASVDSSYRVRGVRSDDVLFIRTSPSTKSRKVGSIPPNGRGVNKIGPCKGNRCKVSYRGITGWSSMKYLVSDKLAEASLEPVEANQKSLYQGDLVAHTTVRQNGIKSKPYKLIGKTYFIEVSGTVSYKTDPRFTDNSGIYGVDACYLFSFTPSDIKVPPVAIKILRNTGDKDVCASARYNPEHIYRSKPFVSKKSYQFWIDNSAYRAKPSGRGFLTMKIYKTSRDLCTKVCFPH